MHGLMTPENSSGRRIGPRRFTPLREHLLAEIEALAIELDESAAATGAGRAPLAARADHFRARDAHHRAAMMWMSSVTSEQLGLVTDALRTCRAALESSRAARRG
jgi:hypothetical protein